MISDDTVLEPEFEMLPNADSRKVLIVDDDAGQTEVLAYRLKKQGYRTKTENSGESGLKSAQTDRPDLIVLDIHMPDMSGLEVCQQLNDEISTCSIPVIIVSGSDEGDVVRQARTAGSRYFVRKPYDPNVLLTLIQSALSDAPEW